MTVTDLNAAPEDWEAVSVRAKQAAAEMAAAPAEESTLEIDAAKFRHWLLPDGSLHRVHGPAVEAPNGAREWWLNGLRHRDDGPAGVYPSGRRTWSVNGDYHRTDGPAVDDPNVGCSAWWVRGVPIADGSEKILFRLWNAGEVDVLEHVLLAWTPDGPPVRELEVAVRAALTARP